MAYPFRNLVFEGGGMKGIAYVGALQVLEEKNILPQILRVAGTSAGAITAAMVGLNYSPGEIWDAVRSMDFGKFMDDDFGVVRDINRLLTHFGWYKGDSFRKWIGEIIAQKTGHSETTFLQVQQQKAAQGFRDMYFIGTNISTHFAEVFSHEHTPRICVADAVRISMSIPLFFTSRRSPRGDVYVDGGVLDNYPIKIFDRLRYLDPATVAGHGRLTDYYTRHNNSLKRKGIDVSPYIYNKETLGFRLDSAREISVFRDQAEPAAETVDDFFAYCFNLLQSLLNAQSNYHLHNDDWHRTIYIDTLGVKTTDFKISKARKNALVQSGRKGTEAYFAWYDDPASDPANRVL